MAPRQGWLFVCLCLTPGFLAGAAMAKEAPPTAELPLTQPESDHLWRQGQEAMLAGRTEEAIVLFQKSVKQDPGLARNYLSLAAAYLEKSEDEVAALYMDRYLQLQPDHVVARGHYAELLLRLKQPAEAQKQYERFIADIQDRQELAGEHLIHCHSRLMEIAEKQDDLYAVHLHRGIGLFWLACQLADKGRGDRAPDFESYLCRAAGELTLARLSKPDEARPCWYLYEVWTPLAQNQPAHRSLCAAEAAAAFTYLTPAEHRNLDLAVRNRSGERQRK